MKTCPHCAADVEDDAVRCASCGRDLVADTGPPPPPPADADRPRSLAYMGPAYALGSGDGFYGIWDARAPGPPVERFTLDASGWAQAWERFRRLEPAGAPLSAAAVGGAPPPPPGAAPTPGMPATPGAVPAALGAQTNGPAVASLVLGIVGVVLGFFPAIGLILGILAVVFAFVGFKRAELTGAGRGLAIAGLVLGALATLFGLLILVVLGGVATQTEQILEQIEELETMAP